ncbi:hypothetical protein, partial [Roseibium sediminis]|uniref:hypothetical protein n=1 Tax=Roseibium sediminis TaxID=1775174 RepID=UPI00123CDF73
MAGYVASKVRAVKDRLLGLWQHARTRRSSAGFSSADDVFRSPHEGGPGGGSEGRAHSALHFTAGPGVERGLQHLVLGGRDAPQRQGDSWQDHSWQDHRAELEITGFLDRL